MNTTSSMEKVAEVLCAASFRRITTPLNLAGIQFDIPAAFVGTGTSSDLILLVDTAFDTDTRIQQKVEGVARALDAVGSKRPLTTILSGPRPPNVVLEAMSRVCRVLSVGVSNEETQDADVLNWLAVLLPLDIPDPSEATTDTMTELAGSGAADQITQTLIEASIGGAKEVERRLNLLISEPLDVPRLGDNF